MDIQALSFDTGGTVPDWHGGLVAALRLACPVVSFTILPTALVVDVSRRNGLIWDPVISCEMIGVCKPSARSGPPGLSVQGKGRRLENRP